MAGVNTDERDFKQRAFGSLAFSVLAHAGAFVALMTFSHSNQEPFGLPNGNEGETVYMDLQQSGAGEPSEPIAPSPSQVEVPKIKIATDENAVLVPKVSEKPTTQPAPELESPVKKRNRDVEKQAQSLKPKDQELPLPKPQINRAADYGDTEVSAAVMEARAADLEELEPKEIPPEITSLLEDSDFDRNDVSQPTPETIVESSVPDIKNESLEIEEVPEVDTEQPHTITATEPEDRRDQDEAQPAAISQLSDDRPAHQLVPTSDAQNSAGHPKAGRPGAGQPGGYGIPLGVQIREANDLIARPGNRLPNYPQQDRLRGNEGTAIIVGRVRPDGTIAEVFLERRSGSPYMDEAALNAFKTWKFQPGQEGYIRQPFQFTLTGDSKINPARLRRQ